MRPHEKYAYSHTSAQAFYSAVYLYATPQRDLHISFLDFYIFTLFFVLGAVFKGHTSRLVKYVAFIVLRSSALRFLYFCSFFCVKAELEAGIICHLE